MVIGIRIVVFSWGRGMRTAWVGRDAGNVMYLSIWVVVAELDTNVKVQQAEQMISTLFTNSGRQWLERALCVLQSRGSEESGAT